MGKTNSFFKLIILSNWIFLVLVLSTGPVFGYSEWSGGCRHCHGEFTTEPYVSPPPGSYTWPDSLHHVHNLSTYMNTGCTVCHSGMGGSTYLNVSSITAYGDSPGFGCPGCHGEKSGSTASGFGLRIFHRSNGYHTCGGGPCHMLPETSVPENVNPPNYGGPYTRVDDSCNHAPTYFEDWSGDSKGLDNDGDSLRDTADPDCPVPTPAPTYQASATSSKTNYILIGIIACFLITELMHYDTKRFISTDLPSQSCPRQNRPRSL